MKANVQWLPHEERELIWESAHRTLESKGFHFGDSRVLPALREVGAKVDGNSGVVRFPRVVVDEALARLPDRIVLAGASVEQDCILDGRVHFLNSGTATHTLDLIDERSRPSLARDLRDATILYERLGGLDILWPVVTANDVPAHARLLNDWVTVLKHTTRHVQHELEGPWQVEPLTRIIDLVSPAREEFAARPRMSLICCTSSPLEVDPNILDGCLELARLGAPVLIYPMPIAGATAPLSIAGTATLNVAEFLAMAVAFQAYAPGVPLIMGAGSSVLDMRSGTYVFGAVESGLMCAACTEVAHAHSIPVLAPGLASDAKHTGVQAGFEKALKGMIIASSGADLITGGVGLLNGANLLSLAQIPIDLEIASGIKIALGEVEVGPESIMLDVVERVPHGGHFLAQPETRKWRRRSDFCQPIIAHRGSYEQWQQRGSDEVKDAQAVVAEVLADPASLEPIVCEDVARELDALVHAASVVA